jgi:hypothetical protein
MKSDFEKIVPEDVQQYKDLARRFMNVQMENIEELNQICIDSWLLASRWSEIQSLANKIAVEHDVNKTDFSTWSYQKYRQLQELHITARSWYRMAKEEEIQIRQIEGI